MVRSTNSVVSAALNRMSARQMETAIYLAVGHDRNEVERLLEEYGPTIRSELGDSSWRRIVSYARDYSNSSVVRNGFSALAGIAAAKETEKNRKLGLSATQSAKKAMGELQDTLLFLGSLAQNGGEVNGVSAYAAWGAVKEINSKLHSLFS